MAIKDIRFETFLTSTDRYITMKRPLVYTNDRNSARLIFDVKDMTESDLSGASAEVLLYMRDGSFYQITNVARNGTEFSYVLKDNEGKHSGTAQLIVTIGQRELATPKFEFVVESGLDGKVATEVMIQDWTTLTAEAQRYIDDFVAAEADRQTTFETNESNRQQTFQANESARQTNENERISNEEARVQAEIKRKEQETERVSNEEARQNFFNENLKEVPSQLAEKVQNDFVLRNDIVNGDFNSGVAGWLPTGATVSAANKILTFTANGSTQFPFMIKNTGKDAVAGHKYFIYTRQRVTNPNATMTQLQVLGSTGGSILGIKSQSSPIQNQYYELYGTVVLTNQTGRLRLRPSVNYPDAVTANGKSMEIDGNAGVYAINMTLEDLEELTSAEMLKLVKMTGYFENTYKLSQKQAMRVILSLVRENRNAILALGGTIV